MASAHQLTSPVEGISCHAWNADRSLLAFSPNNNEIHIYETKTWTLVYLLSEHDLLVSSIDWSPVTNKIVSCSHDRNAFVWTFDDESSSWKPALVILRIDRAALDVKWSNDGLRFAVASGSKCVPVCTYEHGNDWWVCKMVKKKFKSTVLCCAFHPTNGQLLATGSADFKCRIYSTFATDVDGENVNAGPFHNITGPLEFGEAYVELTSSGWVHAVAWSPSGNVIAYASHDSNLHFARLDQSAEPVVQTVRLNGLPLLALKFIGEKAMIGAGHDFNPAIYTQTNEWKFHAYLDDGSTRKDQTNENIDTNISSTKAARELFKNKTVRGMDSSKAEDGLKTIHERAVIGIANASPMKSDKISIISTSGLDGKLVVWNLASMATTLDFAQLSI